MGRKWQYAVLIIVSVAIVTVARWRWWVGAPLSPCQSSAETFETNSNHYAQQLLGDAVIDLFADTAPPNASSPEVSALFAQVRSPYLTAANMSLDPRWASNVVSAAGIRHSSAPAALREIADNEPSDAVYKVIYYPGDTLVLRGGTVVTYELPNGTRRHENLANPGQVVEDPRSATQEVEFITAEGQTRRVLALERDKMLPSSTRGTRPDIQHPDRLYAGTVIVAKRIFVAGKVETCGYDLVLVTDDLLGCDPITLDTSAPARNHGIPGDNSWDYGVGGPGYRGGDVLIVARNVHQPVQVTAAGGKGQYGGDLDDTVDVDFVGTRKIYLEDCYRSEEAIENIPANPEDYGFGFVYQTDVLVDVFFYYEGALAAGGNGGPAGNVKCLTTNGQCRDLSVTAPGGNAGESGTLRGPIVWDLDSSAARIQAYEDTGLGVFLSRSDIILRFCNGVQDEAGNWIATSCSPSEFRLENFYEAADGTEGGTSVYWLEIARHFQPFASIELGSEPFVPIDPVAPLSEVQISPTQFAEATLGIAPRYPHLLLARGDVLYNSLDHTSITNGDADYVGDSANNPAGRNRLAEAEHTYSSLLFFVVDESINDPDWFTTPSANPAWVFAAAAEYRLRALKAGHNYLGFRHPLFIYRKPENMRMFLDQLAPSVEASRAEVREGIANVASAMASQASLGVTVAEVDRELDRLDSALTEARAAYNARLQQVSEILDRLAERCNSIEALIGTQADAEHCDSCGYNTPPPLYCVESTVFNEVELIFQCGQVKPCDFLCLIESFGEFFAAIVQIVVEVGELITSEGASAGQSVPAIFEGIKNAKQSLADFGETDSVIERAVQLLTDLEGATIAVSGGVQRRLTDVYEMRALIEGNPDRFEHGPQALAHIQSLQELLEQISRETEELRRLRLDALDVLTDMVELQLRIDRLHSEQQMAFAEKARLTNLTTFLNDATAQAQLRLDHVARAAGRVFEMNDRFLGLYDASKAYLYLRSEGGDAKRRWNYISSTTWSDYQAENSAQLLDDLLAELQTRTLGMVRDIIAPARFRWEVTESAGGTSLSVVERSASEIAQAFCPTTPCSLTKVAYDDQQWQELRGTGRLRFRMFPEGHPYFDSLPAGDRNGWNSSFFIADLGSEKQYRKRVYQVGARLLFDGFTLPNPTFTFYLVLTHDEDAIFQSADGVYEIFHFPKDTHQVIAVNSAAILPGVSFPSSISADFFRTTVQYPGQITVIPAPDLTALTAAEFRSNNMYGTSVRGFWEIDLRPTLEALEQLGQSEVDRFWDELKGIEFVVYYVAM